MADQNDVRRIALSLPETVEAPDRFAFSVLNRGKWKGIAWVWLERTEPKEPRVPRPDVVAIRVDGESEKEALIAADPDKFFTEPHYNGYPAILVRLPAIEAAPRNLARQSRFIRNLARQLRKTPSARQICSGALLTRQISIPGLARNNRARDAKMSHRDPGRL
ncbi:MAG: hypothetical protein ACRDWH_06320 [Acidimicrobiia bacterium]